MNDPWRTSAEAFALGALDEPDRRAFEEHLRTCPACRAAVEEVGPLPALLDLIPPDLVDRIAGADPATATVPGPPVAQVPDSVLAGALWSVRRREAARRRRLLWAGTVAAAAAVVLALVLPASPIALTRQGPSATVLVAMEQAAPSAITASLRLDAVAWGTRIELTCTYADGSATGGTGAGPGDYRPAATYALVVVGTDRSTEQVATWAAVPGRTITVPAATSLPVSAIDSVELVSADGTRLLTASP